MQLSYRIYSFSLGNSTKRIEYEIKPLYKQLRQTQKLPYQIKENDIIRPDTKKSVKLRSFLIDDILDNDFSTPLNALEQLTCKKAFHRSGTEFSTILGQNAQIKKKRKNRTAFTTYQLNELEKRFNFQKYLTPADRDVIAEQLGLTSTQVITWFQNRRAKLKRDVDDTKVAIKTESSEKTPETEQNKRKRPSTTPPSSPEAKKAKS